MKITKRVIAIVLFFSLIVLSSNNFNIAAKYDQKAYKEKVVQLLKNKKYTVQIEGKGIIARKKKTIIYIELTKNKNKTNKIFKKQLKLAVVDYQYYKSTNIFKINNKTMWIVQKRKNDTACVVQKKNLSKNRYLMVGVVKKLKSKRIKKLKKNLLKFINQLDSF